MRLGPYQWPELLCISLANVAPLPIAFATSRTPMEFLGRWVLWTIAGAAAWFLVVVVVGAFVFRK